MNAPYPSTNAAPDHMFVCLIMSTFILLLIRQERKVTEAEE